METEFEKIFNLSLDMIGSGNLQGYFTKINSSFGKTLGYSEDEILGRPFLEFVLDEDVERTKKALSDAREGKKDIFIENRYRCKDGSHRWIEWKVLSIAEDNKFIAVGRDITERKYTEKLIEASLIEKEVLLKEVHHRVKNNLQIISSLLEMSGAQTENEEVRQLLKTLFSRIHSMALVHGQLYQSKRFDRVQLGVHLRELIDYFTKSYSNADKQIDITIDSSEVYLSLGQAIPCALVLNELLTNAVKHAFVKRNKGTIRVAVENSSENSILISVKDDGCGIPRGGDLPPSSGFGLRLTKFLVERQLKGKVRVATNDGAEFSVEFPKT